MAAVASSAIPVRGECLAKTTGFGSNCGLAAILHGMEPYDNLPPTFLKDFSKVFNAYYRLEGGQQRLTPERLMALLRSTPSPEHREIVFAPVLRHMFPSQSHFDAEFDPDQLMEVANAAGMYLSVFVSKEAAEGGHVLVRNPSLANRDCLERMQEKQRQKVQEAWGDRRSESAQRVCLWLGGQHYSRILGTAEEASAHNEHYRVRYNYNASVGRMPGVEAVRDALSRGFKAGEFDIAELLDEYQEEVEQQRVRDESSRSSRASSFSTGTAGTTSRPASPPRSASSSPRGATTGDSGTRFSFPTFGLEDLGEKIQSVAQQVGRGFAEVGAKISKEFNRNFSNLGGTLGSAQSQRARAESSGSKSGLLGVLGWVGTLVSELMGFAQKIMPDIQKLMMDIGNIFNFDDTHSSKFTQRDRSLRRGGKLGLLPCSIEQYIEQLPLPVRSAFLEKWRDENISDEILVSDLYRKLEQYGKHEEAASLQFYWKVIGIQDANERRSFLNRWSRPIAGQDAAVVEQARKALYDELYSYLARQVRTPQSPRPASGAVGDTSSVSGSFLGEIGNRDGELKCKEEFDCVRGAVATGLPLTPCYFARRKSEPSLRSSISLAPTIGTAPAGGTPPPVSRPTSAAD